MSAYAELVRRYWELRDFDRRKKTTGNSHGVLHERWIRILKS